MIIMQINSSSHCLQVFTDNLSNNDFVYKIKKKNDLSFRQKANHTTGENKPYVIQASFYMFKNILKLPNYW